MKIKLKDGHFINPNAKGFEVRENTLVIDTFDHSVVCISHDFTQEFSIKNPNDTSYSYCVNVVIKNNCQISFIDEFNSLNEGGFLINENKIANTTKAKSKTDNFNIIYNFSLNKDAQMNLFPAPLAQIKRTFNVDIFENASFEVLNTFLKSSSEHINIHCHLREKRAEALVKGIYFSKGKDKNILNAIVEHHEENTFSDLLVQGIGDDESEMNYQGQVVIHKKAQHSSSAQLNKNILLSDKVKIHSKPELKVFADDVQATHGSTMGELSDEELFYFQSRGISKDEAQSMLIEGFLKSVISYLRAPSIQALAHEQIKEILR